MSTPLFNNVPLPSGNDPTPALTPDQVGSNKRTVFANLLRRCWSIIMMNGKMKVGSAIVALFILLAIFGPALARYDPSALSNDILLPPSADHWLGTTQAGQDVFAQLMVGTRYSILWGLLTAILVTIVYVTVGMSAGYFGGVINDILTLVTNVFLVLPGIPLMLIIAAYVPYKGPLTVVAVIMLTSWPGHARVVRSQTMTLRNRDFVEAARVSGISTWRILFFEIFPNMLAIVAAGFVGTMLSVILAAAGLEFLGLGDIRSVSWGSMLYWAQGGDALLQGAWWWFVPPGACIAILGAGLTFINLGLDEVADPRLRGKVKPSKRRKPQAVEQSVVAR